MIIERTLTYEEFLEEPKRAYMLGYSVGEDVFLTYRENKVKHIIIIEKYPWYFCIKYSNEDSYLELLEQGKQFNKIIKTEREGDYVRIYCRNLNRNKIVDEKKELISACDELGLATYEADVSSHWRCLIDHDLEIAEDYRIMYFDIETDDRGKGIVIGRDTILSIAYVNQEGKISYITHDGTHQGEKEMLQKFMKRLKEYDLIAGWNSERFDVPYIRERLRVHHLWYNWNEIIQLDMMQKMMEVHKRNTKLIKEVRSFALNAISKHFLNETKVAHTEGIYELFRDNPAKLKEYNIQDVMLLKKLDEKLNLIRQKIVEHTVTGCFLSEFYVSRILDVYLLKNAKRFGGVRFTTKPTRGSVDYDNRESGYVGGFVLDQVVGIHKNVYHFDFTSLYPSIIQTFNISPESWLASYKNEEENESIEGIHTPNSQIFSREIGIIPKIITDLLDARNEIRYVDMKKVKEGTVEYETLYYKQYAFKTIANSFYGILGAPHTRYYKTEVAEAITASGQFLLKIATEYFEDLGYKVLYGDTDSLFLTADIELDQEEESKLINRFLDYYLFTYYKVVDSKIDLKVEAKYPKMFLGGKKKKYVKLEEDMTLNIMGMEAKRRETLPLAADSQVYLFELLMIKEASLDSILKWLLELKMKVTESLTIKDVTLQIKLAKDVENYDKEITNEDGIIIGKKESKLAHVKVAKWLRDNNIQEDGLNSWEKGCYVKYIVINHKPKVEAISRYQYEDVYDSAYYWNVKVYAILQRILEAAFPDHNWEQYLIEVPKPPRKKKAKEQKDKLL